MNRWITLILCLLMAPGCTQQCSRQVEDSTKNTVASTPDIHNKIVLFQQLVEDTLAWRSNALTFYSYIRDQELYSNKDILLMHQEGTNKYRMLREELLAIINSHKWSTNSDVQVRFTDAPTAITVEEYMPQQASGTEIALAERPVILLNPNDSTGQRYTKEAKISLAAALLLYDNYMLAISNFQELGKTRQLINYDHNEYRQYLDEVTSNYLNFSNYHRTARAIALFHRQLQWEQQNNTFDEDNEYLNLLIQGTYTYDRISREERLDLVEGNIQRLAMLLSDTLENTSGSLTHVLSRSFSSVIGLVELRKGKLTALDDEQRQELTAQLQPLDILLEKTPFRLTDKTIPGYWGHAAVWVGNQDELEQLEIWEHPQIQPFHSQLGKEKRSIIEALQGGVQINTLEHFLNIDDLAVLRPLGLTREERQKALVRAFAQLGKGYDFNFNVETNKNIVCSELAYVVFNEYDWETDTILGRATISPDNVSRFALQSGKFEPALLYLNGRKVQDDLVPRMEALLTK